MKRNLALPIWYSCWLLAVIGFWSLTYGADVSATAATNTALADHLAKLKVPVGFTVVSQPPFVVIGDESPAQVRASALNTVKWAVDKLKQDYFERDPVEIIDIWLFHDQTSYTNHARLLFNDTPTTPFGYYSPAHRALIMNIATGGGTLVHEIVHPFMRANFPECPAWFNEGLASLYEQAAEKQGHIHGTGNANYSQYYAQARYLCYYLQEKGLLTKFYREFVSNAKRDPTGFNTLKRVLGEDDMDSFKKKWEKFVLALRQSDDW
jgi:hypothetical protein